MGASCKATITFGDVKIVLEGPAEFIDEQVAKYSATSTASKDISKNLPVDNRATLAGALLSASVK